MTLEERREKLVEIFSQHPEWENRKHEFDDILRKCGPDSMKRGNAKREDRFVHVCFSRFGLLKRANHYLTHGAEVDGHIASYLFGESSREFLRANRKLFLVSFQVEYPVAQQGFNPYRHERGYLDNLSEILFRAWAFKQASSTIREQLIGSHRYA